MINRSKIVINRKLMQTMKYSSQIMK